MNIQKYWKYLRKPLRGVPIVVLVCILISSILAVYAAASLWTHTYQWTAQITDFEVYKDTELWDPAGTTNLGVDPPSEIQPFNIKNVGNVDIIVTGVVTFPSGSATFSWEPTNSITIPVGSSGSLTLTLSAFTDSGECTVTFTSTAAP